MKDVHGTMYMVPSELLLGFAVKHPEALAAVTKVWEEKEASCDAEGGDDVKAQCGVWFWPWPWPWPWPPF